MRSSKGAKRFSRRDLLRLGGGAAVFVAGASALPWAGKTLGPATANAATRLLASPAPTVYRHLVATDGFTHLTGSIPPYFPDPLAPDERAGGIYGFGFRDVTPLDGGSSVATPTTTTNSKILAQKGKTQASAPLLYFDEGDAIQIMLTNLGLQIRPDLTDSHTIHWHGFRNALPAFDGVPEMSVAAPIGRDLPYYYHATDAGTYMYHCHFEDVEHVQMGMTGIVFVRPAQNRSGAAGGPIARYNGGGAGAPLGYAYNDGVAPGSALSTAYDREFGVFLSDAWATVRYHDAHIQETDWSDFRADFFLMNGRAYPDTLAPSGGGIDLATGDLIAPAGRPDLRYQPISSLVRCNSGERVLLRLVNLGYTQASMRLTGIKLHVVGKDATPLRGVSGGTRTGADTSYYTDTIHLGAGESYDAIFTAPSAGTYLLYNTALGTQTNPGASGLGGQITEVRVSPAGTLAPQTAPNE